MLLCMHISLSYIYICTCTCSCQCRQTHTHTNDFRSPVLDRDMWVAGWVPIDNVVWCQNLGLPSVCVCEMKDLNYSLSNCRNPYLVGGCIYVMFLIHPSRCPSGFRTFEISGPEKQLIGTPFANYESRQFHSWRATFLQLDFESCLEKR